MQHMRSFILPVGAAPRITVFVYSVYNWSIFLWNALPWLAPHCVISLWVIQGLRVWCVCYSNKLYYEHIINSSSINTLSIKTTEQAGSVQPICAAVFFKRVLYSAWGLDCIQNILDSLASISEAKRAKYVLFVHNLDLDGLLILEFLTKKKIKFEILLVKKNIYFLKFFYKNIYLELRCSYKLFPFKLNELISLSQLDTLPAYPNGVLALVKQPPKVSRGLFDSKEDYVSYIATHGLEFNFEKRTRELCSATARALYFFLKKLWRSLARWKIFVTNSLFSISAIATFLFFKKFNVLQIKENIPFSIDCYARAAYYGGRCEVFGNGYCREHIHYFDFPGMYASCMQQKFPLGEGKISFDNLKITEPGFYKITWSIECHIPVLPVRNAVGALIFPAGSETGTYWYEEILFFLQQGGRILKIHSGLVFTQMGYVFSPFIAEVNQLKESSKLSNKIGKLLINSLYGRLGTGMRHARSIVIQKEDLLRFAPLSYKVLNSTIFAEIYSSEKTRYSNVVLAAAITAKARIRLYHGFLAVLDAGGRLLYCDTDSIAAAFNTDQTGRTLGEIYFNKDSKIVDAVFAQPKSYALRYADSRIVKIRGFKQNSISFLDFKKHFYANSVLPKKKISLHSFASLRLKKKIELRAISLLKYNKRVFLKNKKNTIPVHTCARLCS